MRRVTGGKLEQGGWRFGHGSPWKGNA
jgi:hypothetical protein